MSSLSKYFYPRQSMEPSENRKRPTSSCLTPIACRVCGDVFFDNVSLLFHFESHVKKEVPLAMARLGMPFLQSGRGSSLNLSPFSSSIGHMVGPCSELFPWKNKRLRPLSVSSPSKPNAAQPDGTLFDIPILNSMPPFNPSLYGRINGQNVSQPLSLSTWIHNKSTPSSSYPLRYSQAGMRSFAPSGSAPVLPLQFRGLNDSQWQPSSYKNPHLRQLEKPNPEIIVISDDKEDENKNAEIDLTLKL